MSDLAVDATPLFEEHRKLLLAVAYRILGQWTEAEDAVQDSWLRWRDVDHSGVDNPRAFLVQVTTRLSIDRLRKAQTRRETYVGEWLPEPVLTGAGTAGSGVVGTLGPGGAEPDVADQVARADSVSLAMLVVLEALSPLERAVFVLREAFDFGYPEIAAILNRSESAVRQLAKRARDHVERRRTRFETDRRVQREITEEFLTAAAGGRIEDLLKLLAPDVELHSDGGGVAKAPRRTIVGADKVARFFAGVSTGWAAEPAVYLSEVNGVPGLVILSGDEPVTVLMVDVAAGRIAGIHLVANPEKLHAVRTVAETGTPLDIPPAT